jgi:hypothetical protein
VLVPYLKRAVLFFSGNKTYMDVDFAAAVVYDPERPDNNTNNLNNGGSGGRKATASTACSWDPAPTTCDRAATEACVWVDPFWTGVTCQRVGLPVVVPQASHGRRGCSMAVTVAVFRVRGRISPVGPSTLQRLGGEWPASEEESRGMCNSIKIHFFRTAREGGEVRRDFLYSSAFPLEELLPLSAASFERQQQQQQQQGDQIGGGEYGLFNYNRIDSSSDPIPGLRLITVRLGPPTAAPRNAVVYAIQGESRRVDILMQRADHRDAARI